MPQEVVRRLLDHTSHTMTAVYARLADATIRERVLSTGRNSQRFSMRLNGPSRYSTRICRLGRSSVTRLREGLAHQLVGDRHVGDDHDLAVRLLGAAAHLQRAAQRHEFRIALDVGDQIEHVGGGVAHAPLGRKFGIEVSDQALACARGLQPREILAGVMRRARQRRRRHHQEALGIGDGLVAT